jgi:hypothetical protein
VIGLADLNPADVPHDLLTTTLGLGTRRLPAVSASGFGFVPAALVVAPPTAAAPVPVPPAGPAVPAAPAVSPTRQEPASGLPSARPSVTLADPAREDAPTPVDPGDAAVALLDRVFADPDGVFLATGYVPDEKTAWARRRTW